MSSTNDLLTVKCSPADYQITLTTTALLLIDMQRDFLERGGFGDALGNDVHQLQQAIEGCKRLLASARSAKLRVIYTREGHAPDLSDLTRSKKQNSSDRIGVEGAMGKFLVRGELGHEIIDALRPRKNEDVIDKPGKGAFYATELNSLLAEAGVETLIVAGVTTEVCVHSTVREAGDRGFSCLVVSDACGSYFPNFHEVGLQMISAQGGLMGRVTTVSAVDEALMGSSGID